MTLSPARLLQVNSVRLNFNPRRPQKQTPTKISRRKLKFFQSFTAEAPHVKISLWSSNSKPNIYKILSHSQFQGRCLSPIKD